MHDEARAGRLNRPMRLLRALSAALLLVISLGLVVGEPGSARAQEVDEAEADADDAARRAERAATLLSEAQAQRAGVEDELAISLERLSEINARLTSVSVQLDGLRQSVAKADSDLAAITQDLTVQAVDAYVRAVATPAATLIGARTAESAIVANNSLESAVSSDQTMVAALSIKRRELERLRQDYLAQQQEVEALRAEADAEAEHLEELLAEADASLARAAADARTADAAFREALDTVDLARAQAAERQRETQRSTTTTAPPPRQTTTTTTGTSPPPPTTQPPPPVSGGEFPPAVERWRPLVSTYFPEGRVDEALFVIRCESNGDPDAHNPYSGAGGLFQFLPGTWATVSPRAGFGGASVFDPEANIGTAAWLTDYYASRGSSPWAAWACKP